MDRRKKGSFAKHLANEDRAATLSPSRFLYTLPFAQQRNLNDLGTVDSVEVASINTFRFGAQGKGSHRRHHWKTNLQLWYTCVTNGFTRPYRGRHSHPNTHTHTWKEKRGMYTSGYTSGCLFKLMYRGAAQSIDCRTMSTFFFPLSIPSVPLRQPHQQLQRGEISLSRLALYDSIYLSIWPIRGHQSPQKTAHVKVSPAVSIGRTKARTVIYILTGQKGKKGG